MEMDAEKLISSIQTRVSLWDQHSKQYHNRDMSDRLWSEVAAELNSSKDAVKKKWKALRDVFRVEMKKNSKSKSGDEAPLLFNSKWAYFQQMLFLKEQMIPRKLTGNVAIPDTEETSVSEQTETDVQTDIEDGEFSQAEDDCEIGGNVAVTDHETLSDFFPSTSKPVNTEKINLDQPKTRKALKRKREGDVNVDSFLPLEKEKMELLKATASSQNDDNYYFLMSFLMPMKNMSFNTNMLQELLYDCTVSQSVPNHSEVTNSFPNYESTPLISRSTSSTNSEYGYTNL